MGALTKAASCPGSFSACSAAGSCGVMVATVGTACASVQVVSSCSARERLMMPSATTPAAISATIRPISFRWRKRLGELISISVDMRFSRSGKVVILFSLVVAMHEAEHDRYEQQRGDGGAHQAADHRAAERGVLLAAVAETQRHRQHAD